MNPGPSAPESSTLTTRLPSHPCCTNIAHMSLTLFGRTLVLARHSSRRCGTNRLLADQTRAAHRPHTASHCQFSTRLLRLRAPAASHVDRPLSKSRRTRLFRRQFRRPVLLTTRFVTSETIVDIQCLLQESFGGPLKLTIHAQTAAKLCALNLVFGRDNELQIYHETFF